MKQASILIVFLFMYSFSFSQKIKPLAIGDAVPDIVINNIINYKTDKAKISDFKGKLLILDFWATWCVPCIRNFPKMDSLQKKFRDKIQILPVTYQDAKTVTDFLAKMKSANKLIVPSITEDTLLSKYFSHFFLPHYVWINESGIVTAITTAEEVNESNLGLAISKQRVDLPIKKDNYKAVNMDKPIFEVTISTKQNKEIKLDTINEDDISFHSILTGNREGLLAFADNMDPRRFTGINITVMQFYQWALGKVYEDEDNPFSSFLSNSRVLYDIKDSSLLYRISFDDALKQNKRLINNLDAREWSRANTISYELIVPEFLDEKEKFKIMVNDINNHFKVLYGIEGGVEKRKIESYVLGRLNANEDLLSKGGESKIEVSAYSLKLTNKPINELITRLSSYYAAVSALPLIDETGIAENVDLEINCKLSDMDAVNKEIEKYGLKFQKEEREIKVIMIRQIKDKDYKPK